MDPNKKIVDLTEPELIALGFLGKDAPLCVRRIVENVKADPYRLGTVTCFMVDCLKRKHAVPAPQQGSTQPHASPTSPNLRLSSAETRSSTRNDDSEVHTVVAPHLVSKFERRFYYHGISGDPPELMYRSDLEINPYPICPPGARFFTIPTKTVHGVFNTLLNRQWDTVAPLILELMKARGLQHSALKTARFSIIEHEKEEAFGPVVVWIAVRPNTTNAEAVRDATPDILRILADFQITDVVVEWYEGSVVKLGSPPLMRVVNNHNPRFGLNHPFNTGLGIPIARQSDDAQGTLTLLFKEARSSTGDPSDRILALTNKHVACADNTTDYEVQRDNPQRILVCGDRQFARAVTKIEDVIVTELREAVSLSEQIADLEADLGTPKEDRMALRRAKNDLERKSEANAIRQTFFAEVNANWQDTGGRRLGVVDWAPKISVSVDDHHYTRDIATFEVDQKKLENFKSNVVDLGSQYDAVELEGLFCPTAAMLDGRKIPSNLQLPVRNVLPRRLIMSPDTESKYDESLHIVGKYGSTTKLTLGRFSGMEAYICNDLGLESREVAVYNYSKAIGSFSDHGDSGSLIFTGDGDALAILHSGMPRGSYNHVTYGTPIWWVIKQILVKYPFAEFYDIALNLD